jgi:hypothetical protein
MRTACLPWPPGAPGGLTGRVRSRHALLPIPEVVEHAEDDPAGPLKGLDAPGAPHDIGGIVATVAVGELARAVSRTP